jgi:hypothetical protein
MRHAYKWISKKLKIAGGLRAGVAFAEKPRGRRSESSAWLEHQPLRSHRAITPSRFKMSEKRRVSLIICIRDLGVAGSNGRASRRRRRDSPVPGTTRSVIIPHRPRTKFAIRLLKQRTRVVLWNSTTFLPSQRSPTFRVSRPTFTTGTCVTAPSLGDSTRRTLESLNRTGSS